MVKKLAIAALLVSTLAGCSGLSHREQRALTGGALGMAAGAVIGAATGGVVTGALIGGAGGAAIGAITK